MKRLLVLAFILIISSGIAFSADFGLSLDQTIEVENNLLTYDIGLTPWFSFSNGKNISLYLSSLLTVNYSGDFANNGGWGFIPEVSRFSLTWNINENMSLEAGRIEYADVLDFTASGLFDGFRFNIDLPPGTLSAALLYTGLLYKETASIIMTGADGINYSVPFDGKNYNYYSASRRMITSIRWDMPVKFPVGEAVKFSADILAQFDLNGGSDILHSQYASALMEFYPKDMLKITGGLLFGMMQNNNGDFGVSFGLLAQCKMGFSFTPAADLFSVTVKAAFGSTENGFNSYMPVSGVPQGSIFEETLSGLASVSLDYSIEILDSLFAQCALRYYMRTHNISNEGNFYGGEFWASLGWQPLEDIFAFFGGGLFIPGMGNINPDDTVMWKITAGITISF